MLLVDCQQVNQSELNPVEDLATEARSHLDLKTLSPILLYLMVHMIWGALVAFFPLYAINHGVTNPAFLYSVCLCNDFGPCFWGKDI